MPMKPSHTRKAAGMALLAVLLAGTLGCSITKARKAYDEGRYDDAIQIYREVLADSPTNTKARIGLRRAATRSAEAHLELAREAQKRGQEDKVYQEVRKAAVLDPSNAVAIDWITNLELAAQRKKAQVDAAENLEDQRTKGESKQPIQLNPRSLDGVDLNFSRKTSLKEIFSVLSKSSGVNILQHSSYQDVTVSVDLRGLNFQRILDTLMIQNDLFYRVVDGNTIMVFKATPQFRDLYENQILKTFYLSNAEVEKVKTVFQALMPTLKVYPEPRLNALIVKAKPSEITIAKRIVDQLDKAQSEVMIYLELLEVTESSLEQVGLLPVLGAGDGMRGGYGVYRMGATLDNTGSANVNKGGIKIHSEDIKYLFPSLALDFLKTNGDAKLVASPNIRVLSGEKGDINIGEKISTTQSSVGFGTGVSGTTSAGTSLNGAGLQTQYSYEDVGVKITVKPRVHFNNDVTLEIDTEITTLKSSSTAGRPDLGRRKIITKARLKDNETAVFGGMLKEEEIKSLQGIWGITDLPVIGRLLGNNYKQKAKTDVILTVRAALVRRPDVTAEDFESFDPDQATSKAGPFMPKDAPKELPKKPAEPTLPPPPAPRPPATTPDAIKGAPVAAAIPGAAPAPAPAQPQGQTPQGPAQPQSANPSAPVQAQPTAEAGAKPKEPEAAPVPSDLAVFMSPLTQQAVKGDKVLVTLLVSGGKGLSSGNLELKIDPKLKLSAASAGDFLSAEGGIIEQTAGKDGTLTLNFRRPTANADSGTLAILELEAVGKGNAPILVNSGRYLVGTNPIAAKVWNALVTVE